MELISLAQVKILFFSTDFFKNTNMKSLKIHNEDYVVTNDYSVFVTTEF